MSLQDSGMRRSFHKLKLAAVAPDRTGGVVKSHSSAYRLAS